MRDSSQFLVNLSHFDYNFEQLKKIAPNNEIIFMVKSDAYGHGLLTMVEYAFERTGIREFGCASLGEAMTIRRQLKKFTGELLVFSDNELLNDQLRENYSQFRIIPVIHHLEDLQVVLADRRFKYLPLYLHFNTGMNRLGIAHEDLQQVISLLKQYKRKSIKHLMSHYASSYLQIKSGDRTKKQDKVFEGIQKELRGAGISIEQTSLANSGAIEQGHSLEKSHIRPGLMLYGPASCWHNNTLSHWSGKNLSRLETKILDVREVKKGTPIGYGSHICPRDGLLVLLPLGYGDGILTFYSKAFLRSKGHLGEVLGRVNMDLTAILFGLEARECFKRGQIFRLWDDAESVQQLAQQTGTIAYQLFCAISIRIPRVYSLE